MQDGHAKLYSGRIDLADLNSAWTKIVNLVGEQKRVLEVGCATGYMAEYLVSQQKCYVVGIEVNPVAAQEAAARCSEVIIADLDGDALERVTGTFDVIIFADVLEHLRDPVRTLRAAHALLAEGGYVLLSLPNIAHWEVRRELLFGRFDYTATGILDDTHLRFFTYASAAKLILSTGFEIAYSDVSFRGPRYWKYDAFYRRWERVINRLARRFLRGLLAYQFIFLLRPATHGAPSCRRAAAP